jgi:hypothetical protein
MADYPKTLVNAKGDERIVASKGDEAAWKYRGYAAKPAKVEKAESPRTHPTT